MLAIAHVFVFKSQRNWMFERNQATILATPLGQSAYLVSEEEFEHLCENQQRPGLDQIENDCIHYIYEI